MKVLLSPDIAAIGTGTENMGNSMKSAAFLIESRLAEASQGNGNAYFDLGVIYSTGSDGVDRWYVKPVDPKALVSDVATHLTNAPILVA